MCVSGNSCREGNAWLSWSCFFLSWRGGGGGGRYPARCVGRKNEFMTWVNDPCSPHHWVVGTGGQSQADHPGDGGASVRRHQLRCMLPAPQGSGLGASGHTVPTLVQTLISCLWAVITACCLLFCAQPCPASWLLLADGRAGCIQLEPAPVTCLQRILQAPLP